MERKIEQKMRDWKASSAGRTALLIEGARRIGKSYSAEKFAKEAYRSHILIDFSIAPDTVRDLFESSLHDLDYFFRQLSVQYGIRLYERESLIILDEVQLFPKARSAVKNLVKDGRYDFMETGSLISLKENVKDILLPSEERMIKMYPMDLEEFHRAIGQDVLWFGIQDAFTQKTSLPENLHRKAMDLYREYLLVGGMPQAVEMFRTTQALEEAEAVKQDILQLYRSDMHKYAHGSERRAEAVFDSLPGQLSTPRKVFRPSRVTSGARSRDLQNAIDWLQEAMIINRCMLARNPMPGYRLSTDDSKFKCYLGDTGLLISLAFDENAALGAPFLERLAKRKLEVDEGMIAENAVAQMLTASGHRLYYYANADRDDASSRMEVDFLLTAKDVTARHNVCPIEVKSAKSRTTKSPDKFASKFSQQCGTSYVVCRQNLKLEGNRVYLPFYMVPLL